LVGRRRLTHQAKLVGSSYLPDKTVNPNAASYTAQIPSTAVTINNKTIDNTKEEYPLLSFRDITYFPLTWRFAHEEFGWDYGWDNHEGLSITSHNPQLQAAAIPQYAGDNDVALFKGYYYFVETTDTTNHVYRAPVGQPSKKEEIYSYTIQTSEGLQKHLYFQAREDSLWFTYHLGGGFMGHDEFVKISDDGKTELLHQGYLDFRNTPYGILTVQLGASAFQGGNLYLSPNGNEKPEERKSVGDPELMYAVLSNGSTLGAGQNTAASIDILGDNVYVLASRSSSDANNIYQINLKTNKTVKAISGTSRFRVIDNKLYYVKDADNALYSSALDGSGEGKLSEHAVSWFDSIDGTVFYTSKKEAGQFGLYKVEPQGEDILAWEGSVTSAQAVNGQLVCLLGEGSEYGAVVLDGSGVPVVSVADSVWRVLPSDEGILLQTARDSIVKLVR
jgi:hypothetical protein